jgi:hypothetical protein
MRGWSAIRRRWAIAVFVAAVFPLAVWIGCRMGNIFVQADAETYMGMAQGKAAMMPFASRQLGPLMVRATTHLLHLPVESAFMLQGVA